MRFPFLSLQTYACFCPLAVSWNILQYHPNTISDKTSKKPVLCTFFSFAVFFLFLIDDSAVSSCIIRLDQSMESTDGYGVGGNLKCVRPLAQCLHH